MEPISWDIYVLTKLAGILWFSAAVYVALGRYKKSPALRVALAAFVVVCGFFTSKLWYIFQHIFGREPYPFDQLMEAWNLAGSVLYGWIFGGCAAVWVIAAFLNVSVFALLDALLTQMLVAQILNRLGCFSAGCCWGKGPCDLPWAVVNELAPGTRIHPVQLYEAIYDFLLLIILVKARRKDKAQGLATFIYFVGYAIGRFVLEYFRGDNLPVAGLTVAQWTSAAIVIIFISKKKAFVKQSI